MDIPVNYVAVLVAAVVSFFFGWAWHSNLLFGKMYMRLVGFPDMQGQPMTPEMKKSMMRGMVFGLLAALVMAYVLSMLTFVFGAHDLSSILVLGFWMWLGFITTTLVNDVLWGKKTFKHYLFNIVYLFISVEIIALIVGLWI